MFNGRECTPSALEPDFAVPPRNDEDDIQFSGDEDTRRSRKAPPVCLTNFHHSTAVVLKDFGMPLSRT